MTTLPLHGGDLTAARARWGDPRDGWLDLSTGLNPRPWPWPGSLPSLPAECWQRLPLAEEESRLRAAAQTYWSLPSPEYCLAAPGSGALIRLIPRLRPPGRSAIFGITYGEHALAWAEAGHSIDVVEDPHLLLAGRYNAVVVVNPNNPDGKVLPPELLTKLSATMAKTNGLLVVDEAFGDTMPSASVAGLDLPATVVLKSMGKFHGLAGLRLGFAIAAPSMLAPLARALGPWPVSGPAILLGTRALADINWRTQARTWLNEQSQALDKALTSAGLEIIGGTTLFRLARHPDAHAVWERLGAQGILVRAFPAQSDRLRFGLPRDSMDIWRLGKALG